MRTDDDVLAGMLRAKPPDDPNHAFAGGAVRLAARQRGLVVVPRPPHCSLETIDATGTQPSLAQVGLNAYGLSETMGERLDGFDGARVGTRVHRGDGKRTEAVPDPFGPDSPSLREVLLLIRSPHRVRVPDDIQRRLGRLGKRLRGR